jgi:DNA invertase Pin-like site-specific DNA recombinase
MTYKIGYVRVSRENQDPAPQIKMMKDMEIPDEEIFVDHGISGATEPQARPIYASLLKRLADKTKPKVDIIIFSEFSRLGRTSKDSVYELMRLEKQGFAIHSLSPAESIINNIAPEFQLVILAAIGLGADIERKHIRERTKYGLDYVKSHGSKSGRPIGRPQIKIKWDKIEETMDKYKVSENVARKIMGYSAATFYLAKKKLKEPQPTNDQDKK